MSSEEDYSGGGDSSNDDDNEEESTRPTRGGGRRGAVPRGAAAAGAPSSSSSSRRNPRRYTTAEMDKEIAMYKEKYNDEGESGSSSESYGGSDDGAAAKTKQKKKKPVRKSGYKKPTPKKKPAKKANSKKISRRNNKNDNFIADSDEDEFDEEEEEEIPSSDEESPAEDEGDEWNQNNASDVNDSSDAASEGEEDDDSDSDFGAPSRKKKRGANKKKKVAAKKAAPKKRATRNTRSVYQEESSEEEEIEPEIEYDTTPSGSRRPRRQCKTATQEKIDQMVKKDMQSEQEALGGVLQDDDMEHMLEEDDGQYDIHKESSEDSESDRGVIGKKSKHKKSPAKKKVVAKYDEDDSYGEDAPSEEDEGDEDMSDYDESDDGVTKQQSRRSTRSSPRKSARSKATSYKDVDESEDDIGTADEDSNDEATGPSILLSPAKKTSVAAGSYGSPTSRQWARARMGRTPLNVHDDDESNSSDSEESSNNKKKKPKRKRRKMGADESDYSEEEEEAAEHDSDESSSEGRGARRRSGKIRHNLLKHSPTKLKSTHIHCPSKIDDITMMNLPKNKPHVCYIAPDGKTRHCFTLDTLYRIAISANKNDESTTSATLSGKKLTFLQPPHFRSPMEDDLVDQIAGRFGRAALVIENSPIYKKMNQISRGGFSSTMLDDELEEFDEDGEYVGYDDDESGAVRSTNFQDRFDRYLQNLMGSTDVYCCPLCYNEADRRLGHMHDEEMWEDDESDDGGENHGKEGENADRFSFLDDPLTILGCLDHHKFEVAATFCFRLLSGVKKHLKVVHGVNIKEVEGNDLFKRFQVRASDGLLQSWLKRSLRHNTVQGDMMRYWLQGENQSFVLLLSQIDKGQLRGEQSGEYGGDFSLSFPNRAKKIWHDVKGPYLKEHDMGDFIAEEGEEESEDEGGGIAVNPNFTPPDAEGGAVKSSMEQMIENLKKRNSTRQHEDSSDDSSKVDPGDSSDDDELEVLPKPQQYEEVEEADEWTKSKSLKSQKAKQARKLMKDNSDDDDVFDSDAEKEPKAQLNGSARKRVIDDGNGLDSDEEKKPPTKEAINGSARKRVLESSDEESY